MKDIDELVIGLLALFGVTALLWASVLVIAYFRTLPAWDALARLTG